MTKKIIAVLVPLSLILLLQCTSSKQSKKQPSDIDANQNKGLKDYYKEYFSMGAAVSPQGLLREEESRLILQQFNSITAENAMKMGPIHPRENEYFWKDADSIAAF